MRKAKQQTGEKQEVTLVSLSELKSNDHNPRLIKDAAFNKLLNNLILYPHFLEQRPIVHKDNVVYAGNMRLRGLTHLLKLKDKDFNELAHSLRLDAVIHDKWLEYRKEKKVPTSWIAEANDYTTEELKAFVILDNQEFGVWDYDMLANEWDQDKLASWNLDLSSWKQPDVDGEMLPEGDGKKTVSFEATNTPKASDDEHVVVQYLVKVEDKKKVDALVEKVKVKHNDELIGNAFMRIINAYKL